LPAFANRAEPHNVTARYRASLTTPSRAPSVRPTCNTGRKSSYDLATRTICESPAPLPLVPYAGDRAPQIVFRYGKPNLGTAPRL